MTLFACIGTHTVDVVRSSLFPSTLTVTVDRTDYAFTVEEFITFTDLCQSVASRLRTESADE